MLCECCSGFSQSSLPLNLGSALLTDGPSCGCSLLVSTDVLCSSCNRKPHLLSRSGAVTLPLGKQTSREASSKSPLFKGVWKSRHLPVTAAGEPGWEGRRGPWESQLLTGISHFSHVLTVPVPESLSHSSQHIGVGKKTEK